jgi:cytidylate kinase
MSRINIAIDGPAGAGKSTLAKTIAQELGIFYLDTGAMYRAAAYKALKDGVDINDTEQVSEFAKRLDLHTGYKNGQQVVLIDGENVMPFIRSPEVSKAASDISAYPCIRLKLVEMQREVADEYDVVLDGRDIGTFVLPNAKYKFFITADVNERARRRFLELGSKGVKIDYSDVYDDMKARDTNDSNRSFAPLRQAEDAELIDTTHMNKNDVLDAVLSRIRRER